MKLIGLTGSIAMGKSFALKQFAYYKIPVFDADQEVKKLLAKQEITTKIAKLFHIEQVDPEQLAQLVFHNKLALRKLERLLHPLVEKERRKFIARAEQAHHPLAVMDIPLLFEKSLGYQYDIVLTVSAPKSLQYKRALSRPAMHLDKLQAILATQLSDHKKRTKADYIIYTGLSKAMVVRQVLEVMKRVGGGTTEGN
jgi:dephospho-CoA kinase